MDNEVLKSFGVFFVSLFVVAFTAFLAGLFIMLLWNWLMPMIFGLTEITYWQGWGISFLCGLLFKGTTVKTKD